MEPVQLAAILAAVVVLASMLSVELGIAVALFELGLGVVVEACRGHGGVVAFDDDLVLCRDQTLQEADEQ
jgi:hypothetical protein